MSDWDSLDSVEDWEKKLKEILALADHDNVEKQLLIFKQKIPGFPEYMKLFDTAGSVIDNITSQSLSDAITSIDGRTSELAGATGGLNTVAIDTKNAADWLSLRKPVEAVKSLTGVVASLQKIKNELPELSLDNSAEIASSIEDASETLSKLSALVEKIKS